MESKPQANTRLGRTVPDFKRALEDNLYFTRGQAAQTATHNDVYMALAYTVRDHLMERCRHSSDVYFAANPKTVYYLSAEFLMGKQLEQNLLYTETEDLARKALAEYNLDLDRYLHEDAEPGLGNGGLGRLAACFLDSLATLGVPCIGYGIRYEFGIFQQTFRDGWQVEQPDKWLHFGNPWEFPQPDDMVPVGFGGHVEPFTDEDGRSHRLWKPAERILGEPYHTLVPGYGVTNVNILRLWRARASEEFDFQLFDVGDYTRAVEQKVHSENITKVLYPNDNTPQGKELRLRQQYFFVACSLQDIIKRFLVMNTDWNLLPEKAAIQLNDTHPVIAIPELMRMLIDERNMEWDQAWDITQRTFSSTQHTLLPEALETWSVGLLEYLLPRHMEIIHEIDNRFRAELATSYPGDEARVQRMAVVTDSSDPRVHMAHLACVGSHSINGVAELQSKLLKERVLHEFSEHMPGKFNNKTNGVTPRRFMKIANPRLSDLIDAKLGKGWLNDLDQLAGLEAFADDAQFQKSWHDIKHANKQDLAAYIEKKNGITVDPDSIFDVMVKRLHEYKRQLLKALHIVTLYNRIKANPEVDITPRTFIFGAKAAPGYHMAKLIIKLINSIGDVVNHDPDVAGRLKVVFLENFNVTLGEKVYPAADVSEQISLAGLEASGTGNMKFALNGAVTVGTLDGANIEIRERVGEENFFLFGLTAEEVFALKEKGYQPSEYLKGNDELKQTVEAIAGGVFSPGNPDLFKPIVDSLLEHDTYLLFADFQAYLDSQTEAETAFENHNRWTKMSILNSARCGFFSSDRTMKQYCKDIWKTEPLPVDMPTN
jgi:glycogen phosphorylase